MICGIVLIVDCVNSVVWVVSCVFVVVAGLLILYSFSWFCCGFGMFMVVDLVGFSC